jgi:NAD(P)-dependent dehydrogenase (short-subunit alcohol dehydrogenase family)
MANRFENKVVVVTGGTSGIGLATAKAFAAEGASVFITGRRQDALDAAVRQSGGRVTGVQGDVSRLDDIDRLYDAVQQKHSHIDVVFANAGGGEFAPLGSITEEHYQRTFDTNVKGVLFTVQKALPLLRDGGSIVLASSTTSIAGTPAFSVYSATKAAVRKLCAQLDPRSQGAPDPRERGQPRRDRDRRPERAVRRRRAVRGHQILSRQPDPRRAYRPAGGDRQNGAVPRI